MENKVSIPENSKSSESLEKIILSPKQIITLNDFPVYSTEVLEKYYKMCLEGSELPPVPIVAKESVSGFLQKDLWHKFEDAHPEADFFMLDGSHRTTALTLSNHPIQVMLISSDGDIKKANEMLKRGELFGLTIGESFKECIENLVDHFSRKPGFQTVLEKTQKMVDEKVVPSYMVQTFIGK